MSEDLTVTKAQLTGLQDYVFERYPCTCGFKAPCGSCEIAIAIEELKVDPAELIADAARKRGW